MTQVTTLKSQLKILSGNYAKTQKKLMAIKKAAANARKELTITKQIATQLKQVETLLSTTSTVLLAVQAVPPISVSAANLRRAADRVKKSVTPIRQKADRVEKKVKPFREKLQAFEMELGKLITQIGEAKKRADQFLAAITKVDDCIKGLPRGAVKTELRKDLEAFASKSNPAVVTLNTALVAMLGRCEQIEQFLKKITKATDVMSPVLKAVQSFLSKLKVLKRGLDPIRRALEKKITVKVPGKKFSFTIKKVLTSIDSILGIVRKPLMKLAMKVLNPLLKALKLNVSLKIPGLDKLRTQLDVLNVIPNLSLDTVEKKLLSALEKMSKHLQSFDLVCPPN